MDSRLGDILGTLPVGIRLGDFLGILPAGIHLVAGNPDNLRPVEDNLDILNLLDHLDIQIRHLQEVWNFVIGQLYIICNAYVYIT